MINDWSASWCDTTNTFLWHKLRNDVTAVRWVWVDQLQHDAKRRTHLYERDVIIMTPIIGPETRTNCSDWFELHHFVISRKRFMRFPARTDVLNWFANSISIYCGELNVWNPKLKHKRSSTVLKVRKALFCYILWAFRYCIHSIVHRIDSSLAHWAGLELVCDSCMYFWQCAKSYLPNRCCTILD